MEEIWKDVVGYEGVYKVSNFGKIKNVISNKVLKVRFDKDGYVSFYLYKNKKGKNHSAHRLVAKAFIENPNNFPQVNHIDGDKKNNCADNLEWVTNSQNIKKAYELGLMEKSRLRTSQWSKENNSKFHSKKVQMFTKEGDYLGTYESGREIERKYGIPSGCVYAVTNGFQRTSKGFIFKKVE